MAERHWRVTPTASTMVSASTASTSGGEERGQDRDEEAVHAVILLHGRAVSSRTRPALFVRTGARGRPFEWTPGRPRSSRAAWRLLTRSHPCLSPGTRCGWSEPESGQTTGRADRGRRHGFGTRKPFAPSGARTVRATVVQAASAAFDSERCIDRVAELTARAAIDGAELVVFPEAFVGGYPKRADFGTRVGVRSEEGREWFRRYHESAVDVPGPAVDRLGEIARASSLYLVVGVIERDGGTLYCTAPLLRTGWPPRWASTAS